MYLPVSAAITATGLLTASKLGVSNLVTNYLSPLTSSATLVARQDDTKPPPPVTSLQFITSIASITSEPTPTITTTSPKPDIPSAAPSPPVPSTTAETPRTSEQPPTKISTTAPASSNSDTAENTSSTMFIVTTAPTSHLDVDAGPWLSRGKIAGIVVGSVFGLIILGLIIYTLFAASRGINVCNCFGGCCRKHDDDNDEERGRLPSRSDDTYPHPDAVAAGPGGGYKAYRPARSSGDHRPVPLPLVLPQQVGMQQRGSGRLHREYRGA
ncbi:hypothetical protein G6011_00213 [Alternaria panax]|uniref:Uncharacterized protein n=1 Tax=Alternaria panax TaxID=48097 RepID=A0AAD4IHT9_9PLEO|nr:hypothetical protein G6011_00213 [Alternaria panax]